MMFLVGGAAGHRYVLDVSRDWYAQYIRDDREVLEVGRMCKDQVDYVDDPSLGKCEKTGITIRGTAWEHNITVCVNDFDSDAIRFYRRVEV